MYLDYAEKLIAEGVIDRAHLDARMAHFNTQLDEALKRTKKGGFNVREWDLYDWNQQVLKSIGKTAISAEMFKTIGAEITRLPAHNFHKSVLKIYEDRAKAIEAGEDVDWALAESLALCSLLAEGHSVRFSGEDVERGTFSHRHGVLSDQKNYKPYCPMNEYLKGLKEKNPKQYEFVHFKLFNTLLSEYASLGFELGFSWAFPNDLVVWEA